MKVKLFDGIRELFHDCSTIILHNLSQQHGTLSKFEMFKKTLSAEWPWIQVVILVGGARLMDITKSMGLLKQTWKPVKRIGSLVLGFVGLFICSYSAVASSTLPPERARFLYMSIPLLSAAVFLHLAPQILSSSTSSTFIAGHSGPTRAGAMETNGKNIVAQLATSTADSSRGALGGNWVAPVEGHSIALRAISAQVPCLAAVATESKQQQQQQHYTRK